MPKTFSRLAAAGQWTLTALVVVFVGWSLRKALGDVTWRTVDLDYRLLAAGGIGFLLYLLTSALLWHLLTRRHGVALATGRALAVWSHSVLGKYVPGKALMWLIRYRHYRQHVPGFVPAALIRCFFLEYVGGIAAGFALALAALAVVPIDAVPDRWRWLGLLLLAASAVAIQPRLLRTLENRLARGIGLTPSASTISVTETLAVVALYALNWMLLGLAVQLLGMAVNPRLGWSHYLYVTASYTLAGLAGFLAVFAPSGVGVREGVFIAAMSRLMPLETAVVLAVLVRLVATLGEVAAGAAGLLYSHTLRIRHPGEPSLNATDEAL